MDHAERKRRLAAHWDASPPDYSDIVALEASGLVDGMPGVELGERAALEMVGLGFSREQWERASSKDRALAYKALKIRIEIAAAIDELLMTKDGALRRRVRYTLDALVRAAQSANDDDNGYEVYAEKRGRVEDAAALAAMLEPRIAAAKAVVEKLKPHEDREPEVLRLVDDINRLLSASGLRVRAESFTRLTHGSPRSLARLRPLTVAVSVAARLLGLQPSDVLDELPARSASADE